MICSVQTRIARVSHAEFGVSKLDCSGNSSHVPRDDLVIRFAENVRLTRDKKRLTQEQAAERAGLNVRSWQKVEGATAKDDGPTLRTIEMVATGLDVHPADLLR